MTRGGIRPGAGRPKGLGKFGEKTKPLRVPESMVHQVLSFIQNKADTFNLPLYSTTALKNATIPAARSFEKTLDINKHLIKNPSTTFFVRSTNYTMADINIYPGDIVIVDSSRMTMPGDIIVALLDGELTIKRYIKKEKKIYLLPENALFEPIEITEKHDFYIWGTAISTIHKL